MSQLLVGFAQWLDRIVESEVPDAKVVAFNIGLFESDRGYMAYLVGSESYSEEDADWACEEAFTPEERYFPLQGSWEDWTHVLEAVVAATRDYLSTTQGARSFLGTARAVTAGFDDGDLVRIR
jgi:hypothetical protein